MPSLEYRASHYRNRRRIEKLLGHPLGKGRVHVHSTGELVVCEDNKYHKILHRRIRARDITGHPSLLKCWVCKQYDNPENIAQFKKHSTVHPKCAYQYHKDLDSGKLNREVI